MSASEPHTRLLTDEELRVHLERGETVVFRGLWAEWQRIERQVAKLGFGEVYFVTQRKGPRGGTIE